MDGHSVAIVGVTGAVGQEMVHVLHQRKFPVSSLKVFASARSAGKKVKFNGGEETIIELTPESFERNRCDIALMSAGAKISREYAPRAVKAGTVVIDNSSAWRMDPQVPLVVPEVNPGDIKKHKGIIANPNCTAAILCVPLKPIDVAFGLERVVVSTYQAVSGKGARAVDELDQQTRAWARGEPLPHKVWPFDMAFNVITLDWKVGEDGYTEEETKVMQETRKILGLPDLRMSVTTVRVPVFRCHSESVNIQTRKKATAKDVRKELEQAEGVKVLDDPATAQFPRPKDLAGTDPVFVGRIREDHSVENGINIWAVGDQLRKGAALNAVQIAERLLIR
ncbi:MAG: aspartate-semialdehyde dehydrogenase [Nitrospirae bacterium]|nr:aspartate-semialdehyde dehydrogenase [Nitrospirota bacterium]